LPGTSFDAQTNGFMFDVAKNGKYPSSPQFFALADLNPHPNNVYLPCINVYFLYKLKSAKPGPGVLGVTKGGDLSDRRHFTIVMSDQGGTSTLAHEVGHVLGLDDIESQVDVTGTLNNFNKLFVNPTLTAIHYNLMSESTPSFGQWMTQTQATDARNGLKAASQANPQTLTFTQE
jgi:hypothetical protein